LIGGVDGVGVVVVEGQRNSLSAMAQFVMSSTKEKAMVLAI
jgi:hypothetical protein